MFHSLVFHVFKAVLLINFFIDKVECDIIIYIIM